MTSLHAVSDPRTVAFKPCLGDVAELRELLTLEGALRPGHFRLLSNLHTDCFLSFSVLADDPRNLDRIADWLGPTVDSWQADVVLAPSTAGVGLAATLGRRISAPLHLVSIGADGRPTGLLGSDISDASRVVIVNDVNTTGTAIATMADIVTKAGGTVAGAAWFASRGFTQGVMDSAFPTAHVVDVDLPSVQPADCPQCAAGVGPVEDAFDLN